MIWQFTPYVAPLLLTSAVLAGPAVLAWRHRPAPGAKAAGPSLARPAGPSLARPAASPLTN